MSAVPTLIRIDSNVKEEANELFSQLGMDMSSAVNIFPRQCIIIVDFPSQLKFLNILENCLVRLMKPNNIP